MAGIYNFDIDQGATFDRTVVLKDANNVAITLTNDHTFTGQVRTNPHDPDIAATITCNIISGSEGKVQLKILNTDTVNIPAQKVFYDVFWQKPTDFEGNRYTTKILEGYINVSADVTKLA